MSGWSGSGEGDSRWLAQGGEVCQVGALGGVTPHAVRVSLAAQRPLETLPETARHEPVDDRVHRAETHQAEWH